MAEQPTLALIHTTPVTVPAMRELAERELAGVRVINILDDSLLADVIAAGGVTEPVQRRLRAYVAQAEVAGADTIMSCCSSIGEAVESLAAEADLPILRIDAPMAEEAVRLAAAGEGDRASSPGRIGVLATVRTTLEPTAALIRRTGARLNQPPEVHAVLVEGAYEALRAGQRGGW
jgi:hypothetical protein